METQKVVKQVVGIDIGKESFYACYKIKLLDESIVIKGTKSFENTVLGQKAFYLWCENRNKTPNCAPIYVMEATGVYYEDLAYYLYEKKQKISVQLAQKIKYFAKSFNLKTKTDKVDSIMIAAFGIEKSLTGTSLWTPPSKEFKIIRDLSREHTRLKQDLSAAKSQLHAFKHAHKTYNKVVELKKKMISFYEKQIESIEKEIEKQVAKDEKLHEKIENIEAVKGLGLMTIIKVLSETNGFILFKIT